ncbi:MAG: hypothetical protein ACQEXV_19140 [Bacillota bacterium]
MRRWTWKGKAGIAGLSLVILLGIVVLTYFWQMRMQKPFEVNMAAMQHMSGMNEHEHGTMLDSAAIGLRPTKSCEAINVKAGK